MVTERRGQQLLKTRELLACFVYFISQTASSSARIKLLSEYHGSTGDHSFASHVLMGLNLEFFSSQQRARDVEETVGGSRPLVSNHAAPVAGQRPLIRVASYLQLAHQRGRQHFSFLAVLPWTPAAYPPATQ